MAHLAPFMQFLFSIISIQLGCVPLEDVNIGQHSLDTPLSLFCSSDQFACADGKKCIPNSELCNGYRTKPFSEKLCNDRYHNFPSQCNNCIAIHLFQCQVDGVDVCMNVNLKCNGKKGCCPQCCFFIVIVYVVSVFVVAVFVVFVFFEFFLLSSVVTSQVYFNNKKD